jgi:hypothetical protein
VSVPPARPKNYLGVVLLISTRLAHVGAMLRQFGFDVHELTAVPAAFGPADRRGEVQLVILEEGPDLRGEVPLLLRTLSLASLLIVGTSASPLALAAPSERCQYLAPAFSPFDLTLAIVDLLKRRRQRGN